MSLPLCLFCLLIILQLIASENQTVIIDTDAGADDAMAIIMLLSSEKHIQIKAITCVQGNTGVGNVSVNVLKTLKLVNRLDIPVYVGSDRGLVYSYDNDYYFGYDGLGDFEYKNPPNRSLLQTEHAAVAIAEMVRHNPGEITIMALGPLTNLALASHINRQFFTQVKNIIFLGGCYKGQGNMGPGKEFNINTDPEAAALFFRKLPVSTSILMIPYETNEENTFSLVWRLETLGKLGSKKMEFLNLAERKELPNILKWTPNDQLAAAALLYPDLVLTSFVGQPNVNTAENRGVMTVRHGEGSVRIATSMNTTEIEKLLIATMS